MNVNRNMSRTRQRADRSSQGRAGLKQEAQGQTGGPRSNGRSKVKREAQSE